MEKKLFDAGFDYLNVNINNRSTWLVFCTGDENSNGVNAIVFIHTKLNASNGRNMIYINLVNIEGEKMTSKIKSEKIVYTDFNSYYQNDAWRCQGNNNTGIYYNGIENITEHKFIYDKLQKAWGSGKSQNEIWRPLNDLKITEFYPANINEWPLR